MKLTLTIIAICFAVVSVLVYQYGDSLKTIKLQNCKRSP